MARIKIPECRSPFVVLVNGKRYEYESGKEVVVPDEVAAIIEYHVASKPKPLPYIPGGDEEGYRDGYEAGYALGHTEGKAEGYESGHTAGYEIGFEEGSASGGVSMDTFANDSLTSLTGEETLVEVIATYEKVVLPNVTTVGDYYFAENGGADIVSISLPNATSIGALVFRHCNKLKEVDIPNVTQLGGIGSAAFTYCAALEKLDLPKVTQIRGGFVGCTNLKTIILRSDTICTIDETGWIGDSPNCCIYVPDTLVDSYKEATNWAWLADNIRPLSEYVEV